MTIECDQVRDCTSAPTVLEDERYLQIFLSIRDRLPKLKAIVLMEGEHEGADRQPHDHAADGITSSDTQRGLLTRADSTSLLIALALCVALGVLGGAVLRATNLR